MATSVTHANVYIPASGADGSSLYAAIQTFAEQIAALSVAGKYAFWQAYQSDGSTLYILDFFILAANDTAALADYTAFAASLPSGTTTNIVYSNQTLGV